jgi:hypothetical protein
MSLHNLEVIFVQYQVQRVLARVLKTPIQDAVAWFQSLTARRLLRHSAVKGPCWKRSGKVVERSEDRDALLVNVCQSLVRGIVARVEITKLDLPALKRHLGMLLNAPWLCV